MLLALIGAATRAQFTVEDIEDNVHILSSETFDDFIEHDGWVPLQSPVIVSARDNLIPRSLPAAHLLRRPSHTTGTALWRLWLHGVAM